MLKNPIKNQPLKTIPLFIIIIGVYTIQSLIGAFASQGLPAIMRSEGVSTIYIGLFHAVMMPWVLRFLWAPIIERQRKKGNDLSNHGLLILIPQVVATLIFIFLALTSTIDSFYLLFASLTLLAIASTCADTALDGLAVDELPANKRYLGNMVQVSGAYLGMLFGGGLFIYLSSKISWQHSIFILIAIVAIMSLPSLLLFNKKTQTYHTKSTHKASLKNALMNPKVRTGLIILTFSQLGTRSVMSMITPFLIDQKMDLESLGILAAGGGIISGVTGMLLGGLLVKKLSATKGLLICLIIEALLFIIYFLYGVDLLTENLGLQILFVFTGIITAAKFVSLYSMMMSFAHGNQSAIDFTLFQCMDMLISITMAIVSGFIIDKLGYSSHYGLAIFTTMLAIFILIKNRSKIFPSKD